MAKKFKKSKFRKELKKTLRRNQTIRSNKLIYAVAIGLAIILFIWIISTIGGDKKPRDKEKIILNAISYLKRVVSIRDIKVFPRENKVVLIFDSEATAGGNADVDFRKMARYAGMRISNELKREEIKVLLSEVRKKEQDYLVTVKNGGILSERLLEE
ncbi:MAG: hypothetical protein L0Y73_00990, partial [Candidatus Aminicenantes bacterium]|nr:hypothetical protein [Candidatus Aminicenantes bacterium]